MPAYRYAGDHPVPDGEGGVVRPGEERDYDELPPFGPWDEIPPEPEDEPAPAAPAKPAARAKAAQDGTETGGEG